MSAGVSIEERQELAFADYLAKQKKAEASGELEDAIAAGKAWGRFLDLFATGPVPNVALVRASDKEARI